jgi:hypothetical protein
MPDAALATAAEAAASREVRLAQLEETIKKLQPKKKDAWEKLQALSPLISGILVAVVGYFLTGSVNSAIQRQQLQLSNVREMRELLVQLGADDPGQVYSAAFALSAFGRPAVPALIAALAAGGELRAPATEAALRTIGLNDPDAVCEPARRILDSRSAVYSWLAHLSAIRLLGDLECRGASRSVAVYAKSVDAVRAPPDVTTFAARVAADPPLDFEGIGRLQTELQRTMKVLQP